MTLHRLFDFCWGIILVVAASKFIWIEFLVSPRGRVYNDLYELDRFYALIRFQQRAIAESYSSGTDSNTVLVSTVCLCHMR